MVFLITTSESLDYALIRPQVLFSFVVDFFQEEQKNQTQSPVITPNTFLL